MPTEQRRKPITNCRIPVKVLVALGSLLGSILVAGCGSNAKDTSIGPSGGTVSLPGGAQIVIPSGAVASATNITIEQTAQTTSSGAIVYRFGPEGTVFTRPVTVTLPLPQGITAPAVYWSRPGSATAFDVLPATVTAEGVRAQGSHFSTIFVGPSTGSAVCTNAGTGSDGTACGAGLFCVGGICGASISGTVAGAIAAGVTVSLGGTGSAVTTTGSSGEYTFGGLTAGSYTVTPSLAGYSFGPANAAVTVTNANVPGRDFTATGAYAISGTVSGAIVAGVTLSLGGAGSAVTTTGSSGEYSFSGLTAGSYTVTPSLAGYAFSPAVAAVTVTGASVAGQDFTATGAYAISGTVAGAIAAGVTVSLGGTGSAVTATGSSGEYSFGALTAGSYTVTPSLAGYVFSPAAAAVPVTNANVLGKDFTATGAYAISGTVSGAIVAGVTVSLGGAGSAVTATGSSGEYSFGALTAGSYTVTPSLAGYAFSPAAAAVTVTSASVSGQDFSDWQPILQSVSPAEGHVSASITLTGDLFGASDSGGSVTMGNLPMAVVSWSNTKIVATVPSGATSGDVRVHVAGGDSSAQPFTVTATVAGQVVDGSGDNLAGNWAFGGDGGPAQLVVSVAGTSRSSLSVSVPGSGYGGMPRAFSLEVPLGTRTFTVQELDGQGSATVDLLQSASRQMSGVVVGEDGIANLEIPVKWHWEVHALNPGYAVCGYEKQIWFHDALHGFVTFQVNPGMDPTLDSTNSAHIHGMVMSTEDGGKSWAVANPDISTAYNDFRPTASGWFPNGYLFSLGDGTVLSIGDNGQLARSPDSGGTWETAWLNWATLGPGSVAPTRFARAGGRLYVSITTGGVQGSYERSRLVYSEDEGLTWNYLFDVCNTNYLAPNGCATPGVPLGFAGIDMACSDLNPQNCITMGYEHDNYTSKVMVTRDGFQTYTTISPKCGYFPDGQVLWMPGTDTAFVVGSSSCPGTGYQYIVTTDGGQTWSDWAPSPFPGHAVFTDSTHALSWWDWGVRMSHDAATSWVFTGHAPAGGAQMRTVHALDAEHAWVLGNPDCRYSGDALVSRWVP